jgi:hypothetical protein
LAQYTILTTSWSILDVVPILLNLDFRLYIILFTSIRVYVSPLVVSIIKPHDNDRNNSVSCKSEGMYNFI